MIIKNVELYNFRQYKGRQIIHFSTDSVKNVTIIKGENGAGKTTLLEAFTWCFYNKITLPNEQKLITTDIFNKMNIGDDETVYIAISFIHNDREYYIKRSRTYRKQSNDDIKVILSDETFQIKGKNGTFETVKSDEISNIVPSDLATYFFFDGERIENISKLNRNGQKDLNNAIRNILGLDVVLNASKHLKKVINDFEDNYNCDANSEMTNIKIQLVGKRKKKEEIKNTISCINQEITYIETKLNEISDKLKSYEQVKVYEKEREEKEQVLSQLKEDIEGIDLEIKKINKRGFPEYLAKKVLHLCSDKINLENLQNRGIVGIDGKAIDHLIDRRRCICGQEICAGSSYFSELLKQKEYQPPASLATILEQFNDKSNDINKNADDFYKDIKDCFKSKHKKEKNIEVIEECLNELSEKLKSQSEGKKLEEERISLTSDLNNSKFMKRDNEVNLDAIDKEVMQLEKDQDLLALDNEKNKIIALRKAYSCELLKQVEDFYGRKEKAVKEQLNEKVVEIFNELLCTNHTIEIGDNYSFKVRDIDGEESTSQGQDVITSFAFIGGIIQLAKEKHKEIEVDEPYPLIMDAPFAKLSKAHRRNVANRLPDIAEQFILITVDSQYEGDIEEALRNKIGKEYELVMHRENEKYTEIAERK